VMFSCHFLLYFFGRSMDVQLIFASAASWTIQALPVLFNLSRCCGPVTAGHGCHCSIFEARERQLLVLNEINFKS